MCVWGSAGSNRKNDENGGVWVCSGWALKLEKAISTCDRSGRGSSVQKVETREKPDLGVLCVCVGGSAGSNRKNDENGGVWVRLD